MLSKLGVYVLASYAVVAFIGVTTARQHDGRVFRTAVSLTLSGSFSLAAANAALATTLAGLALLLRLFFGTLHALEATHAWECLFRTSLLLLFGPSLLLRPMPVGAAELGHFAALLVFHVAHSMAAKRQQLLEQGVANGATGRRFMRLMLLLGALFLVDALAVASFSDEVGRTRQQLAELAQLQGTDSAQRAAAAEDDLHDAMVFSSVLLLHWGLLATQCLATTLLAALDSASGAAGAIRRPDAVQLARLVVEAGAELVNCVLYATFFFRVMGLATLFYFRDVFLSGRRLFALVRDYHRHRRTMRWVMGLPKPTDAQLRGGDGDAAVAADGVDNEPVQCAICYDGIGDDPAGARCLPCGHIFHVPCLSHWLERNGTCPYCQRDFRELRRREAHQRQQQQQQQQQQPQRAANADQAALHLPRGAAQVAGEADGRRRAGAGAGAGAPVRRANARRRGDAFDAAAAEEPVVRALYGAYLDQLARVQAQRTFLRVAAAEGDAALSVEAPARVGAAAAAGAAESDSAAGRVRAAFRRYQDGRLQLEAQLEQDLRDAFAAPS